jgi:hypothetical protein
MNIVVNIGVLDVFGALLKTALGVGGGADVPVMVHATHHSVHAGRVLSAALDRWVLACRRPLLIILGQTAVTFTDWSISLWGGRRSMSQPLHTSGRISCGWVKPVADYVTERSLDCCPTAIDCFSDREFLKSWQSLNQSVPKTVFSRACQCRKNPVCTFLPNSLKNSLLPSSTYFYVFIMILFLSGSCARTSNQPRFPTRSVTLCPFQPSSFDDFNNIQPRLRHPPAFRLWKSADVSEQEFASIFRVKKTQKAVRHTGISRRSTVVLPHWRFLSGLQSHLPRVSRTNV